jgi:hypothetical protein
VPPRVHAVRNGRHVTFTYCFSKPLAQLKVRPWRLYTTIDNLHDRLPPETWDWPVKKQCGKVIQDAGQSKPPFRLLVTVRSSVGIESPPVILHLR